MSEGSHLRIDGGVLGLNSDDFTRGLGTGSSQVDWTGSGGFAAYGAERTVNLGGTGAGVVWGQNGFVPDSDTLVFGAQDADATLNFVNGIALGREDHLIEVISGRGSVAVDARLSGVISGFSGKLVKGGLGTLELTGANTYAGGTSLAEGTLIGTANGTFGTGAITVGTTTDTRAQHSALELQFKGNALSNAITFGSANLEGISTLRTTATNVAFTGAVTLQRTALRNVRVQRGDCHHRELQQRGRHGWLHPDERRHREPHAGEQLRRAHRHHRRGPGRRHDHPRGHRSRRQRRRPVHDHRGTG